MVSDPRAANALIANDRHLFDKKPIRRVVPKLESLSAGQMGYSTSEVGDLVCENL